MDKLIISRAWFYFRNGWGLYFSFVLGAVNTLTVTYYLAIDKIPAVKTIFSSFAVYVTIAAIIGIPVLVLVGYVHYKRSSAYKGEVAISMETDPYRRRFLVNSELILELQLKLFPLLIKLSKNEKLSTEEIADVEKVLDSINKHKENRSFHNNLDLNYMRERISKKY